MMTRKNNKTCICCQTKYTFCPNCSDFDHLPRWMTIFHDANCREIFNTLMYYNSNDITEEEAKTILDKCDLSKKETFAKKIKEDIDKIYRCEIKEDIVEENIVEEVIKENVVETNNNKTFIENKSAKNKNKHNKYKNIVNSEGKFN